MRIVVNWPSSVDSATLPRQEVMVQVFERITVDFGQSAQID
jgi:hypothetical protein